MRHIPTSAFKQQRSEYKIITELCFAVFALGKIRNQNNFCRIVDSFIKKKVINNFIVDMVGKITYQGRKYTENI